VSGHSGYASWFLWAYIGVFALFSAIALWWLVDVVRRPLERFPGTWRAPRLRWGLVPAAWFVVVGAQLLAWAAGLALRAPAAAQKLVSAANLGLVTLLLPIAMVVVGIPYLLRVAFPRARDAEERPDPMGEETPEEGAAEGPGGGDTAG
jgi:hypothetical protein